MKKPFLALLIFSLGFISCPAQETNLLISLSPKLRSLLTSNSDARSVLTGAWSAASRTNSVQVTYFYSEDETLPRAHHFYPHAAGMADVVLCIRENQEPLDEFACIFFELLNSRNQGRFEALVERARAGAIEKTEFVRSITRIEFESDLAVRDLFSQMTLTEKQKAQSYFYTRLLNCPSNFEEALVYRHKVSPNRNSEKKYGAAYDALRRTARSD
jgi:hypothetical protein